MKLATKAFLILTACALALLAEPLRAQNDNGAPPPPPQDGTPAQDGASADDSASFQTFYDSLGSQGNWIQSSDYGYVWQPGITDPGWAPYTEGHWVYTDDGWAWVSDEPWGWATYHYGRWVNLDGTGWCWVPGYTWAPAWVSWRYGGGYCGWAPLPPDSFVGIDYFGGGFSFGIGFHIGGDCDGFFGIGAGCYNFVPVNCLGYASYHNYYVPRYNNYTVINRTTNVTNINVTKNGATTASVGSRRVTTGGPSLAQVNAVSQTPIQRVSLVRTNRPGEGGRLSNNTLAIYAPHIHTSETVQPGRVAGSIGAATINRGTDITRPLVVNPRLAASPASEAQVREAREAQNQAPASAKIVTASTPIRPVFNAPLTSLKPVTPVAPSTSVTSNPRNYPTPERSVSTPGPTSTVRTYPGAGESGTESIHRSQPAVTPSASPSYSESHSPATGEGPRPAPAPYAPPASRSYSPPPSGGNYHSGGGNSASGNQGAGNRGGAGGNGNNKQQNR